MSREAWGDPPDPEPVCCPNCGEQQHTEGCYVCELDVKRIALEGEVARLATEERTLRLRYGVVSGWIVQALKVLDTLDPEDSTEADELRKLVVAGEVLALTTLASSKTPNMDAEIKGELWSWVRSVMSQGADIRCDYDQGVHKGYEAYSARLDVAATERAEELLARLKTPNGQANRETPRDDA